MCQSHGFKVYLSFLWLDAIPSVEQVRLAPSLKSQRGAAWCKTKASFNHWELEMMFRVSGRSRVGADGLVRKSRRERFRVIWSRVVWMRNVDFILMSSLAVFACLCFTPPASMLPLLFHSLCLFFLFFLTMLSLFMQWKLLRVGNLFIFSSCVTSNSRNWSITYSFHQTFRVCL